jgi:hypothetical protein
MNDNRFPGSKLQDPHQRIHYLLQFMKTADQTWGGHLEHRLYCLIGEVDDPENHY